MFPGATTSADDAQVYGLKAFTALVFRMGVALAAAAGEGSAQA
jgi:hypothetical protein